MAQPYIGYNGTIFVGSGSFPVKFENCSFSVDTFKPFSYEKLIGLKIKSIEQPKDEDDGLFIVLEDGQTIDVGFSGDEGSIRINGEAI